MESGLTRRQLLEAALVLTPVALTGCATTSATDRPELQADDPVARSLAYFPNTNDVPSGHPLAANHAISQRCADCLHQRGAAGDGLLRCPSFPGRAVSENGWCSLWTKG